MNEKLRVLDLFSGIGGFSLGLERTGGFETVAFCEIRPERRRRLARHWRGVPLFDDVRGLRFRGGWIGHELDAGRSVGRGVSVGRVDFITAGFPCQDISVVGKRAGLEGKHSGLWFEVARLVREARPRYILLENSPSLLVRGLDRVLGDLADAGYDAEWDGIPAAAIGAHHLRAREWVLAYPSSLGDRLQTDAILAGWDRFIDRSWWSSEPGICRMDDGIPDRVDRVAALGDTIIPQIAEIIGYAILEAEKERISAA